MRFMILSGLLLASGCGSAEPQETAKPEPSEQEEPAVVLNVGDPVPDFDLIGSDGNRYGPGQFKGVRAMVIAWFPKAFTAG